MRKIRAPFFLAQAALPVVAFALSAHAASAASPVSTLDLAGQNVTLPALPYFATPYLSGTSNVTNSGLPNNAGGVATLTEGGTAATNAVYSGSIGDGLGAVALTHTGGSVTLSGTNTYSGATTVNAGALLAGSASGFSGNSAFTIASGATLDLNGYNSSIGSLAGAGTVTNSGAALATLTAGNGGGQDTVFSGVLKDGSNPLALYNIGSGTLTLSGANTYSGGTTVDAGPYGFSQLLFASPSSVPAVGSVTLLNGGVAGTTYAVDQSFLNKINPASVGVVALGADSANNLDFNAAGLQNVSLGAGGPSNANGTFSSTYNYSGTLTPYVTSPGATAVFNVGGGNQILNISSNLTDTAGTSGGADLIGNLGVCNTSCPPNVSPTVNNLVAGNNGYTILSGTNTYSGGTTINSGILQFAAPTAIPNAGTSSIQINPYAVAAAGYAIDQLFLNSIVPASQGTAALAANSSNNLDFNAAGLSNVSLGSVGYNVYSGTITPYTGESSTGTFQLGGGGGPCCATLTVSSILSDANPSGYGYNNLIVNNSSFTSGINVVLNTTETYSGSTQVQGGQLQLGDGISVGQLANTSGVQLSNFATLYFDEPSAVTFDKLISGYGSVGQGGGGVVTLTQAETYSGYTLVFGGTLALASGASIANSYAVLLYGNSSPSATFDISAAGNQTIQNLYGQSGTFINLGANTLTIGNAGAAYTNDGFFGFSNPTFAGVASGTGGLTFQGTSTFVLSGANTYSGMTNVNAGTLQGGAANAFSPNSAVNVAAGATLDLGGFGQTVLSLSGAAKSIVTNSGKTAATLTAGGTSASSTFSGAMQDGVSALALTKTGTGVFTLAGANSYSGATNVSGGTLLGGANNAFSANSAVIVASGAKLDLGGYDQTIGSLAGATAGAGTVTSNGASAATLTLGGNNQSTAFGGLITDGTGSTLAIAKTGTGTFTISGVNSYSGGTTIYDGTISINNANALGTNTVYMNDGTTLAFSGTGYTLNNKIEFISIDPTIDSGPGTITQGGAISGAGALTKIGTGTLILTATNSYTGNTNVNVGTLQVDGSIATSPTAFIASGATLSGIGTVGGITAALGSIVAPGNPVNPFGTLTAAGPVTLAPGSTLLIATSPTTSSLLSATGAVTIGGALDVNGTAGINPAKTYTIVTSTRGVTGTFTSAATFGISGYQPLVTYDAHDAYLSFVPNTSPLDAVSAVYSAQTAEGQRQGLIVTNRVLASILGGFNEQINCTSCISGFGSVGSFSAGFHGRKALTDDLAVIGGFAYAMYKSGGIQASGVPIGVAALRYDLTEFGPSRPFAEGGTIVAPSQNVSLSRKYIANGTNAFGSGTTTAGNYSVFGRLGWVWRLSPTDEASAGAELSRNWQRIGGYTEAPTPLNPTPLMTNGGTDRMNIVKAGGQWTHLFGSTIETQINLGLAQSFGSQTGENASFLGGGTYRADSREYHWTEYGLRVGYRIFSNTIIDAFTDGTLGALPIGNTIHGGLAMRYTF